MVHGTDERSTEDRSIGQLINDATDQVRTLIRDEIRLATAELQRKGRRFGSGAGAMGGAGVLALYGGGALIAAVILLLAMVLPAWASAAIVGAVLLIAAAVLAMVGRQRMREAAPPIPEQAMAGVKQDIKAVKEGVQR
jgi:Flp pilus assembly protein TadB